MPLNAARRPVPRVAARPRRRTSGPPDKIRRRSAVHVFLRRCRRLRWERPSAKLHCKLSDWPKPRVAQTAPGLGAVGTRGTARKATHGPTLPLNAARRPVPRVAARPRRRTSGPPDKIRRRSAVHVFLRRCRRLRWERPSAKLHCKLSDWPKPRVAQTAPGLGAVGTRGTARKATHGPTLPLNAARRPVPRVAARPRRRTVWATRYNLGHHFGTEFDAALAV